MPISRPPGITASISSLMKAQSASCPDRRSNSKSSDVRAAPVFCHDESPPDCDVLARPSPWGAFTAYSLPASWRTLSWVDAVEKGAWEAERTVIPAYEAAGEAAAVGGQERVQ